jgi:hypothetical protein
VNDGCSSVYAVSILNAFAARHRGTRCLKTPVPVNLSIVPRFREPKPTVVTLSGSRRGADIPSSGSLNAAASLHSASISLAQLGQLGSLSHRIIPPLVYSAPTVELVLSLFRSIGSNNCASASPSVGP